MTKPFITALLLTLSSVVFAQPCTPQGDQNTYGTNDQWIGYVYDDIARTTYMGYVNEGIAGNPNFDQSFIGSNTSYPTNGCPVSTTTFSVRYKLQKTFASGSYSITVGGDDGYRLSLDGGATWAIDAYTDRSYGTTNLVVALGGPVSLVLDYYENSGDNRVSFSIATVCTGTENTSVSGTGDVWRGYVYDGTAFNVYAGMITQGSAGNADFDQSFGGNNVTLATSGCGVNTETFSVRYRLTKTFVNKSVSFTVGADDGFRLSLDGGTTWLINRWSTQSYVSNTATATLNGTYNMVLEYYENTGENRVTFAAVENFILPLSLTGFTGVQSNDHISLRWTIITDNEKINAEPQRSTDGINYTSLAVVDAPSPSTATWAGTFKDAAPLAGRSYYRLKINRAGGPSTYSSVLVFGGPVSGAEEVRIFPSVVGRDGTLTLVNGKRMINAQLTVHDASGRLGGRSRLGLLEKNQSSGISLQSFHLQTGVHLISITDNNGITSVSKVLVK